MSSDSPLFGMAWSSDPQSMYRVVHDGLRVVVAHFSDKSDARGFYLALCSAREAWPNVCKPPDDATPTREFRAGGALFQWIESSCYHCRDRTLVLRKVTPPVEEILRIPPSSEGQQRIEAWLASVLEFFPDRRYVPSGRDEGH